MYYKHNCHFWEVPSISPRKAVSSLQAIHVLRIAIRDWGDFLHTTNLIKIGLQWCEENPLICAVSLPAWRQFEQEEPLSGFTWWNPFKEQD